MILAVALLEQKIAILPMEPDTVTYATFTMMVHVTTFIIGQTTANYVDIEKVVNYPMLPILTRPRGESRGGQRLFLPDWYVPTWGFYVFSN